MKSKKIKRQAYGQIVYRMHVGFDMYDYAASTAVREFASSKHSNGVTSVTTELEEHPAWVAFTARYEGHCSHWTPADFNSRLVTFMRRRGIERERLTRVDTTIERPWIGLFCDVHGVHCHRDDHQTDHCECMPGFPAYEDEDCTV